MNIKYLLFFAVLLFTEVSSSQITLVNASFEDTPSDAQVPKGWLPCADGTTPDILPGFWGEYGDANHGNTYMGLITRENSTFESIGQRLSEKLNKDQCYKFKIDMAHGQVYSGYDNPIRLRVWLGNKLGEKGQAIFVSDFIDDEEWETVQISFTPEKDYQYFMLEAFYIDDKFTHKGNILLDNMTPIFICGRA